MPADTTATDSGAGPTSVGSDSVARARATLADVPREPGAKKPDPIVVADHIRRTFGGLTAVDVQHVEDECRHGQPVGAGCLGPEP